MAKKHRFLEQSGGDPFSDEEKEVVQTEGNEFAEMIARESARGFAKLRQGDKIDAKVVGIVSGCILCDVGQRSEGVLVTDGLTPEEIAKYKVGETYSLYVSSLKNGIELATSISTKNAGLDGLMLAMNSGLPIEGKVVSENKGGFSVEITGAKAFCPFSQMDIVSGKPPAVYIGQTFRFKIIKVAGRDVVLSRSVLLREEQAGQRAQVLEKLEVGQTMLASVVKLETFGAFVDIGGGLNALVPMSELSWSRVASAHAVVAVGDKVSIKILKIDTTGDRPKVSASMKQVVGDPWDVTVESLETGSIVDVKITRLMEFGAFAEILPAVEGLIHISEITSKRRISTPGELLTVGQSVKVKINAIDRIQRRIGLSMKVLETDVIEQEGKKRISEQAKLDDEHRGVEHRSVAPAATMGNAFLQAMSKAKQGK